MDSSKTYPENWRLSCRPHPKAVARVLEIPLTLTCTIAGSLMILAIYVVVILSYILHYDEIRNGTACAEEKAFLPAASWPIGIYEPQRFIWMFAIVIHFPFSFFYGWVYQDLYRSSNVPHRNAWYFRICLFMLPVWNVIMMFGLAFTSIISVEYEFHSHTTAAVAWVTGVCGYMFCHAACHHLSGWRFQSRRNRIFFVVKCVYFCVSFVIGITLAITYPYYTAHCNLFAYTLFGACEYAVGHLHATFMGLHMFELPGSRVGIFVTHPSSQRTDEDFPTDSELMGKTSTTQNLLPLNEGDESERSSSIPGDPEVFS